MQKTPAPALRSIGKIGEDEQNMKKISIGTSIALAAMTAAITVSVTYLYAMDRFNSKVADINERQSMYAKLTEIDQKVRKDAVGNVDETAIKDGICAGYVAGLGDVNAKYISAEKYKVYLQGDAEKSVGIGVRTIQDEDGNMEIVEVLPGSSAEKNGLKKGDVILSIDGKDVVRITYGEAVSYLDGAAGTEVSVQVLRMETEKAQDGSEESISKKYDFTLERAEYVNNSVDWNVINGNVGYIALRSFSETTSEEMRDALNELQKQQVCGLVLDLRNNNSGTVERMVESCQKLLPAGNVAQYVNNTGETVVEYTAGSGRIALPLTVVVNDSTYGAAEVLAAAIRDGKGGTLVGSETAGAASKQETIQLSDGSALILTVGYYVDAQGNSLYETGVAPDREIHLGVLQERVLLRELLDPMEDPQVQSAVTALIEEGAAVQQVPGSSSDDSSES